MAKTKIKKIVFVCTGNTCRSPMAEAAFAEEIRRENLPAVATSAGIKVSPAERDLNPKALFALQSHGLDLPYFSSTSLTKETLMTADIIICMTRQQRDLLKEARQRFAAEEGKARIRNNAFCFFDLTGKDVPDPYGKSEEEYLKTFDAIVEAFPAIEEKWFAKKPRSSEKTTKKGAIAAHKKRTPAKRAKGAAKKVSAKKSAMKRASAKPKTKPKTTKPKAKTGTTARRGGNSVKNAAKSDGINDKTVKNAKKMAEPQENTPRNA